MILLNAADISKSYTEKPLLSGLSLSIHEKEKLGLIGVNGTGKSTFLRILAGQEDPDSGTVILTGGTRIGYLPQNPVFRQNASILSQVLSDTADSGAKEYECKNILTRLGITDFDAPVDTLSGGQRKRVALAACLVRNVELLILDEPTNHLDSDMVEWLEQYLRRYKGSLLMITHDRYFLDRVTNGILELENGTLSRYDGSYSYYLEAKEARQEMALASERKRQAIYKKELAWIRRGAQARSTKAKSRIERFEELKNSRLSIDSSQTQIDSVASRLGKKVIEINHLSKASGDRTLISDFDYILLRNDRVGIIGPNGSGKSTLLKIIQGLVLPDSGTVEVGDTVRIGYFSQENTEMNPSTRVIDYVQEVAFNVRTNDGIISASQMLERFLFPSSMHSVELGRLSGGEKRRLYLLRVLMEAPNVLLFDEPTNDLDITTLAILEDYLDSFPGAVIIVSHDRYFLDRLCVRIFAFEEGGRVGHYPGGYTDYMEIREMEEQERKQAQEKQEQERKASAKAPAAGSSAPRPDSSSPKQEKKKFTYNEQREFDTIDREIAELEERIKETDRNIAAQSTNYDKLQELLQEKERLDAALSDKMDRWVYLNDLAEQLGL